MIKRKRFQHQADAYNLPATCQICACDCGLLVSKKNNRITDITGDPQNPQNRGAICLKGRHAPDIVYSPDRILYPMIRNRKSEKSEFRRISWDDALGEIAGRLEKIRSTSGPEALCTYQGKSTRFIDRTFIAAFAALFGTPNKAGVWSFCVGPKFVGYKTTFGPPPFAWCDFSAARLIVLWGTNPAVTNIHRNLSVSAQISQAVKRGARLVIVDPRPIPLTAKADLHLSIKPGTDTFLAMALIKVLIENSAYNRDFVEKHTEGFASLKAHVKDFNIGKAAQICGIPEQSIITLGEWLGKISPAAIDRREGTQHLTNATQLNRCLAILLALTGNVDIPGALTFNPPVKWKNNLGISAKPQARPFWSEKLPLAIDGTGLLPETILSASPYPIRALISVAGNPVSVFPNTKKTVRALNQLDLLVCNDIFWSETARMADIVLPGVTFLEKGEFETGPFKYGRWIKLSEPLIKPLGESLPEWKFFARLAETMGYDELSGFEDEDAVMQRIFQDSGYTDLNPGELRSGRLLSPLQHGNFLKKGFNTQSGKIQLYSRELEKHGYPPLPEASDICPESPEFPYRLITGARVTAFYHSQHRNIPALRKLCPEPVAELAAVTAEKLGIMQNDIIEIVTSTGKVRLKASLTDHMNLFTVSIPHGWPGRENANLLTDDLHYDPEAGTPGYRAIPCSIRKAAHESAL